MLTERMNICILVEKSTDIDSLFKFTQVGPGGSYTRIYQVIANVPNTRVVVQFMIGFVKDCRWNTKHGFRMATQEEKDSAQAHLDALHQEIVQAQALTLLPRSR